jgi:hypothetical protein
MEHKPSPKPENKMAGGGGKPMGGGKPSFANSGRHGLGHQEAGFKGRKYKAGNDAGGGNKA